MTARVGTGWQTTLADLSLILFMVTASAVSGQPDKLPTTSPATSPPTSPPTSPRSEPTAVWVGGPGAPALRQWLAGQPRDPRQQVTISARYAPGRMAEAAARAQALADEAGDGARIVVEPGAPDVRVVVGFDAPAALLAHSLRSGEANHPAENRP